ncbi:MAG: D-aminoacyl-tRNA deacylase [Methanomicrobiales archaeon]|nr:D-aminoacyl-tRNA deacylase [Methanomicrobiales archaeon]
MKGHESRRGGASMRYAFVNSAYDPAGRNIRGHMESLLEQGWRKRLREKGVECAFVEVAGRLIHADRIDSELKADAIVFLSRHTSHHPAPMLTVHAPGNFGSAELGGSIYQFPPACPALMRAVLVQLHLNAPSGYHTTYEATHHGPTEIDTPCLFLEIGSTEKEWCDPVAGFSTARSMLLALCTPLSDAIPLLGLGGDHYATRATRIALASRGAFGHIVPAREVQGLEKSHLARLMERTGARAAYIDRQSLERKEVEKLDSLLCLLQLPLLGEKEIEGLGELDLDTYLAIRELARGIYPDSHVHIDRLAGSGAPVECVVPEDLLAEALRADRAGILGGVKALPVCHLTGENGNLLPCFITFEKWRSQVINDLIRLCIQTIIGCKKTSIDGDCLIILESRFDPEKARMLGIPAGSLYKKLSRGEAVELEGKRIAPEMVQTWSQRVLHIPELERYR